MADPKTDALLKEYLEADRRRREKGITLEAMHGLMLRVARQGLANEERLNRHGRRIGKLEHEVALLSRSAAAVPDWDADPAEITGTHQFEAVRKALPSSPEEWIAQEETRRRDSGIWWKRQRWLWFGIAAALVFSASLSGCITYAVTHIQK